jgi:hypothetical protein
MDSSCNIKAHRVTAFLRVVHLWRGGDAPSARCGETKCNITSKTKKFAEDDDVATGAPKSASVFEVGLWSGRRVRYRLDGHAALTTPTCRRAVIHLATHQPVAGEGRFSADRAGLPGPNGFDWAISDRGCDWLYRSVTVDGAIGFKTRRQIARLLPHWLGGCSSVSDNTWNADASSPLSESGIGTSERWISCGTALA